MANFYVYSGATGAGTGADWTNAFTTLNAAVTASASGDTLWVAHDHSESTASALSISFKGSAFSAAVVVQNIYCVNRAVASGFGNADLRTTAVVATTGNNALTLSGIFYCYGINFSCGTGAFGPTFQISGQISLLESCNFSLGATSSPRISIVPSVGRLLNCTFTYADASSQTALEHHVVVDGPSSTPIVTGPTIPNTWLTQAISDTYHSVLIRNADLSNLGSSFIFSTKAMTSTPGRLINCKLPSGTLANTDIVNTFDNSMQVIGCNSAGGNVERNEIYMAQARLLTETTVVRTGGASDGTTPFSWKLVPIGNTNSKNSPLETFEGAIWNDITGSSKTLTVHLVTDNLTLTTDDIWLEVDYLGSSSAPLTTRTTSATALLGTASNLASDSGTAWTTTGLTTPNKQKLSLSFTPQMAGLIRWRLRYATSGNNTNICYVCPKADLA